MTSTGSPSPTGPSPHWPTKSYLLAATFGLIYFLAVYAGLLFVTHPEGLSLIWPASGVALAILLLRPRREWPVILGLIFIVNLISNIVASGTAPLMGAGFALVNTLEPALGGWLMARWLGNAVSFTRLAEVVGLVLVATLANALTAGLGALIPVWAFGAVYANTWLTWWVLDGLSLLIITPAVVTLTREGQRFIQRIFSIIRGKHPF